MKKSSNILVQFLMFFVMISFLQCSSSKNIQNKAPFKIGEVFYHKSSSENKEGYSGTTIYVHIIDKPNNITLDSIYFMKQSVQLEQQSETLFTGRLKTAKIKSDIIMSSDPYAEYGNQAPMLRKKIPFKLNENECVISYHYKNETAYFKIDNVHEKEPVQDP